MKKKAYLREKQTRRLEPQGGTDWGWGLGNRISKREKTKNRIENLEKKGRVTGDECAKKSCRYQLKYLNSHRALGPRPIQRARKMRRGTAPTHKLGGEKKSEGPTTSSRLKV